MMSEVSCCEFKFIFFDILEPDDHYTPKVHLREELDALKIPMDRRDTCKDYYADFKKCIMVQHQTTPLFKWKKVD